MRFYFVYLRLDWLWSLNLFALILLNFLEKPLWCRKYAPHACDQRDLYFLGQLPYLSKKRITHIRGSYTCHSCIGDLLSTVL
uniref:TPC1 n=1 Tax=Arundo donax TaxID=35708 RepID=A0A0A9CWC6_ARUDO